ncbi:MAG: DUF2723 domain-containing protein [Bacteroidales bacterium]|nr:DUF2723 domain-containing protein [Bacteroidales bacterium]
MNNFRKFNLIIGWSVFLISAIVYFLTLEPTASWWDCGEYIATAYKLQVGHPPGAPTFQLIGRFFSLFAFGDVSQVALMINSLSALASAFTVLFLFWTITHFGRKLLSTNQQDLSQGQLIALMGSAFVGALSFTFSDSFWFSAVEGEVYALSSFFTAIVFWAILKWETLKDEKHSLRWIILIAYLIGLSIGVHLLNLLAIPAIAFVVYFNRFKPTRKGIIFTFLFSIIAIAAIMFVLVPWTVRLSGNFELFFTNTLGLGFNTGTIVFFILLIGLIVWGLYYTRKKGKLVANTAVLMVTFILIGYTSFFMLIIRANADTPINENNPSNAISLLSYLNREQYGDWPISYGQYYNAPLDQDDPYSDGRPTYVKDLEKGKYVMTDDGKNSLPNYDERFETVFPRMWSSQKQEHIKNYKRWGKVEGTPIQITNPDGSTETRNKPTFIENLRYFFRYQVGHMYFRYFMWNFSGRQNDTQGHGSIKNGNWLTGINFIDEVRLGEQDELPQSRQSPARNTFYMLPFILGLIGFFYHWNKDKKDAWVITLLFIMTGLAIIIYLNQYAPQPRERDYAFAGSFYAFAIWIGLGALAIYDALSKKINPKLAAALASVVCFVAVPLNMGAEGWDDHDRSNKYAARDFASNYLNSCEEEAVLITHGDNDTFPLWYAQEVEGMRTDIRVVNFMLASGDWYIHQLMRKIYDSDPMPFTLKKEQYNKGVNDIIPYYDRGIKRHVELQKIIDIIASDKYRMPTQGGDRINFLPTKKVKLTVDSAKAVESGIVPKHMADRIVPEIKWKIKKNYLYPNDLMLLDFLASHDWSRPLYLANPSSLSSLLDIDEYLHLEGFAYKLIPVKAKHHISGMGGIHTDKCYNILMNKCKWGNLNKPSVYVDPESQRNSMIPKQNFRRLAQALLDEGKKDSAIAAVDRCLEVFPNDKFTYDMYMLPFADIYYQAGATEKANKMVNTMFEVFSENMLYYSSLNQPFRNQYSQEKQEAFAVLQRLSMLTEDNGQKELSKKISDFISGQIQNL